MTNAQHTMNSHEHYTPTSIIEMAREVLGDIDLDPCSSETANKIVQAKKYFTKECNGLRLGWCSEDREPLSVWCNPPGSQYIKPSLPMLFWQKLLREINRCNVTHAIFLAYSPDMVRQSRKTTGTSMLAFPVCQPDDRIVFLDGDLRPKTSPPHGNLVVYIPGVIDNTEGFKRVFSQLGYVKV
ncbi:DNA N-6-adenine-methyltransferase [Nostoc sp.]|uniref:DNA N-6-adenine-methyltransferase n=1 Tax=Nostoc sp. TaxID=1180 RepID=UPI002FF07E47